MVEEKQVSKVQLEGRDDLFYGQERDSGQQYETTRFEDPDLVNRLQASGCEFGRVAEEQMNPLFKYAALTCDPDRRVYRYRAAPFQTAHEENGRRDPAEARSCSSEKAMRRCMCSHETGITFNDVAGRGRGKGASDGDR